MNVDSLGRLLVVLGLVVTAVGALLWLAARVPFLGPLGNLPGDFLLRRGPVTIFVPLATMILLSIILTVVLNVVLRFLRR
jgi:hypothetical protein